MNAPTYKGDSEYSEKISSVVEGDEIRFERAVFTGHFKRAKFSHFELITGKVVAESYGAEKQQHTFTILLDNGYILRIKGRNLYKNGVWMKPRTDIEERCNAVREKHERGEIARAVREQRKALLSL